MNKNPKRESVAVIPPFAGPVRIPAVNRSVPGCPPFLSADNHGLRR